MTQILLFGLLGLFVLSNVGAIALGTPSADGTRRAIPWLQRSTSFQLALMAWLFWLLGSRGTRFEIYSLLIAIGMTVSGVADLVMAEMIRLRDRVVGGMLLFAVAHALYSLAYVSGGRALGVWNGGVWWAGLGLVSVVIAGIGYRILFASDRPAAVKVMALGYGLLVGVMLVTAVTLAIEAAWFWVVVVGALLFMISDVILGTQLFRQARWRYLGEVVWLTYIAGQACIVWSNYPLWAGETRLFF